MITDNKTRHPAVYTNAFIPIFAKMLIGRDSVLDPCAGSGKLALIKDHGYKGRIVCNEIEEEWVTTSKFLVDEWHIGDAALMEWAKDASFDAICTSPTYGNRMADHHNAKDGSKRITYKHCLGRNLNSQNTGKMQWGTEYREKHIEIFKECFRVLRKGGIFILNISDHIRKGLVAPVSNWHCETLEKIGFKLLERTAIKTPRMGFGKNAKQRVAEEYIFLFIKNS